MKLILIGGTRRDGKQKAKLVFPGGPNMFGGHYPPKVFTKLLTPEQLADQQAKAEEVIKQ